MSIFFALLARRRLLPGRGRPLMAALLLAATAACCRADEPAPRLADSGVAVVPADAAFVSATLRGREQYDRLVKSNAWAAILDLPAIRRGLTSLEEQRTLPGSPLSLVDTFMQLPENAQALELLADMVASDTFVYGEPSCVGFLRLLQLVQTAQAAAPLEADGGDVSAESARAAAIAKVLTQHLDLVVVPDVVWGFRTTKADAAKSQLKRVEVLLRLVTQANPDLADAVARRQVAGGDVVTFTVRGGQLPWGAVEDDLERMFEGGDAAALTKLLERVKKLDLVIAIGLIGDRVLLSIGDAVDHLEKLALPGRGRPGLLGTKPFEPLLKHADKRLTGVSYMSDALMDLGDTAGQFAALSPLVDEALKRSGAPAEAVAGLRQLFDRAGKDLARRLPEPGPLLAFSFLTEQGYEGYAWDWSRNQPFDGGRRLDLLDRAEGRPLALVVSRGKSDPALLADVSGFVADGWRLLKQVAAQDAEARERAAELDEHVAPLVAKLGTILGSKLVPALADGQVGLILDAKETTERLQKGLPAAAGGLPLLEPAIVLPLADPKLFREALSDLFELADAALAAWRRLDPDAVPEGYEVPDPEKTPLEAGSVWSFALPKSGLDDRIRPAVGIDDDTAVFSLVRGQAQRLLGKGRLRTGAELADFAEPLASAAALDWPAVVDAVEPWIVYLTRYGCVQQRDGAVAADEELTAEDETPAAKEALAHVAVVLEAARCLRAAVAETKLVDDAMVTHWRNVIRDMPPRK